MRFPTLLATLVVPLLSVSLTFAQNTSESFGSFKAANDSGQLGSSNDSIDLTAFQQSASASTLFETEPRSTTTPLVADQSNAQQKIVSNTLTLMGAAFLISVIVVGTFVYSTRRDKFGERRRARSDW